MVAGFTGALFVATALLWIFTWKLWGATTALGRSAHEEFVASHRPRLRVRFVRITAGHSATPIRVAFSVYNVGETRAIITDSQVDLQFHMDRELPPPPHQGENRVPAGDLEPSHWHECDIQNDGITLATVFSMEDMLHSLYLIGSIRYRDANNTLRQMGFCRRFDRERERFDSVDDPDYEYED